LGAEASAMDYQDNHDIEYHVQTDKIKFQRKQNSIQDVEDNNSNAQLKCGLDHGQ